METHAGRRGRIFANLRRLLGAAYSEGPAAGSFQLPRLFLSLIKCPHLKGARLPVSPTPRTAGPRLALRVARGYPEHGKTPSYLSPGGKWLPMRSGETGRNRPRSLHPPEAAEAGESRGSTLLSCACAEQSGRLLPGVNPVVEMM